MIINCLSKHLLCYRLSEVRNHVLIDVMPLPLTQFSVLVSLEQCLAQ